MPRTADDASVGVDRPDLLKAMSEFVAPCVFGALDTGGWAWSAWMLALGAILMAWDSTPGLVSRFDSVRAALRELFPKKPLGGSYQGLIKALMKHSPAMLSILTARLRQRLQDMAAAHWLRQGRCAFAVDGSRVECPRTAANQEVLAVYLWPDKHRKKNLQPLVLRLIQLHDGRKPVFLLTSVLDAAALSDQQAGVLYRMRWGIEVFYRSLKQTPARRKMHSAAPPQAQCELSWAVIGLWTLAMMSVRQIVISKGDPLALSAATALRQVRLAIRYGPHSPKARILLGRLHAAVKDSYVRRTSKKARDWPHKKKDKPPGLPRIQIATQEQLSQIKALYVKIQAA